MTTPTADGRGNCLSLSLPLSLLISTPAKVQSPSGPWLSSSPLSLSTAKRRNSLKTALYIGIIGTRQIFGTNIIRKFLPRSHELARVSGKDFIKKKLKDLEHKHKTLLDGTKISGAGRPAELDSPLQIALEEIFGANPIVNPQVFLDTGRSCAATTFGKLGPVSILICPNMLLCFVLVDAIVALYDFWQKATSAADADAAEQTNAGGIVPAAGTEAAGGVAASNADTSGVFDKACLHSSCLLVFADVTSASAMH